MITEIEQQTITVDGTTYTPREARATAGQPSMLQRLFGERYGAGSFHAALADFLAEWFDGSETLKVHTSGSTGTPKELQVEKRRMMNSAVMTVSFLGLKPHDTAMLCMPLQYIAGKMVVVRALVGQLDLLPVTPCGHPMQGMKEAPVFSAMIPMQVYNSLQVPEERKMLEETRHLIIGGGAIDDALAEALKSFPHAVWSTYGMTETLSHIALRRLDGPHASTWYTPFGNVSVSPSDEGTLVIHAPAVSKETLVTNDIVEFNAEGQFRILGRKDNTINTGGVKVQIEQVEELLKKHLHRPFQITAAPDACFGEHIVLLLEKIPGSPEEALPEDTFATLPPYWRPKQVMYVDKLPLTGTGKPDRAAARRIARGC